VSLLDGHRRATSGSAGSAAASDPSGACSMPLASASVCGSSSSSSSSGGSGGSGGAQPGAGGPGGAVAPNTAPAAAGSWADRFKKSMGSTGAVSGGPGSSVESQAATPMDSRKLIESKG
jgi:hypothetical protein